MIALASAAPSAWPIAFVLIAAILIAFAVAAYSNRTLRVRRKFVEPDDPDHRRIFHTMPFGKFIEVDGFKIRFVQCGSGPDVVLVHGFCESIVTWRLIFNHLAQRYRVTAFDLPGFGFSSKYPDKNYDLDTQADRVSKFLDALTLDHPHLVGHSMGAAIIARIAKSNPKRIGKVALLAPAVNRAVVRFHPLATQWLGSMVKPFMVTPTLIRQIYLKLCVVKPPADLDEVLPEFYRPFQRSSAAMTTAAKHSWILYDKRLPAGLANLNCPILVMAGEDDQVVKLPLIEEFLRLNPSAQCIVLAKTGHQIHEEQPREVVAKLCDFFDSK